MKNYNDVKQAMVDAGIITPDPIISDGKLHRCHVIGDKAGTKNAWYIVHLGPPATAIYGDWKRGIKEKWCAKDISLLTPEEYKNYKQQIDIAQKGCEEEREKIEKEAQNAAEMIWLEAQDASDDHPYLIKKGVKCIGLRTSKEALVIPMHDVDGILHSLQYIRPDGEKRFLKGGRKKGCFYMLGNPEDVVCIAEGYATAASIHEATGYPVAVAFDAGNLQSVAKVLRDKLPDTKIVVCADNDAATEGNPGLTKAKEAAEVIGGYLASPEVQS